MEVGAPCESGARVSESLIKPLGEVGPIAVRGIPGGKTIGLVIHPDSAPAKGKVGVVLSNDQSVDLARLLIKTAAANGWGSDEDRERLIAWAPVKR